MVQHVDASGARSDLSANQCVVRPCLSAFAGSNIESVRLPKGWMLWVVAAVAALAVALFIGVYFYMQYSPND